MVNKQMIRAAAALAGMTMKDVANAAGMDTSTLYRKLNGTSEFRLGEAQKVAAVLSIDDVVAVFFDEKHAFSQISQKQKQRAPF